MIQAEGDAHVQLLDDSDEVGKVLRSGHQSGVISSDNFHLVAKGNKNDFIYSPTVTQVNYSFFYLLGYCKKI